MPVRRFAPQSSLFLFLSSHHIFERQFLRKNMVRKPTQLLSRVPRRVWRWIFRISLALFVLPLILQWIVAYLVGSDARILPPQLLAARNLLIVTAHPDDECLFFAPSILGVLDRNRGINGGLLVMSTGILSNELFML